MKSKINFIVISLFLIFGYSYSVFSQEEQSDYYQSIINDCNVKLQIVKNNQYLYASRGIARYYLRDYLKAINDLDTALQVNEKQKEIFKKFNTDSSLIKDDFFHKGEVYLTKALSYFFLKKYDLAENNYKLALSVNPEYYEAYFNLGILNLKLEKYNKSIEYFDSTLSRNPLYYSGYLNRGYCYLKSSKLEKALNDFKEAIKIDDNIASAYKYIGIVYLELKDNLNACKNFELAKNLGANVDEYIKENCK